MFMVFMIERATEDGGGGGGWTKFAFHLEIHLVLSCCSLLLWFLFHNNLYRMNFKWNLNLFNDDEEEEKKKIEKDVHLIGLYHDNNVRYSWEEQKCLWSEIPRC